MATAIHRWVDACRAGTPRFEAARHGALRARIAALRVRAP